jgi:hypothetical protein
LHATKIASVRNATQFLSADEAVAQSKNTLKIVLQNELQEYMIATEGQTTVADAAALGVMQRHENPQSHHYRGPHGNAGKVPRTKMRRAEALKTASISDYHACFEFYIKEMPM